MDNDIFSAGVRPGAPTSHDEIKMLLCYTLGEIGRPVSFTLLHEALREKDLVNYFDLVQVSEELVATGHLTVEKGDGSEQYGITELGVKTGLEFKGQLPSSVREKAVEAVRRQLRREEREASVSIRIEKAQSGYEMHLSIPEAGGQLIAFSLFLPTREECETIRRRFLNDPLFIYKGVLALLTGDRGVLGDLLPSGENLF